MSVVSKAASRYEKGSMNNRFLKMSHSLTGLTSQRVTAYFEPDLVQIVDAYGEAIGLPRSGAIRRAVILGLQTDGVDVSR